MTHRKLKIYPKYRPLSSGYSSRVVPELRLCGVWLEQLGFKVGEQVRITVKEHEIVIKPSPNGNS